MRLSTKGRYAARAMLELAIHYAGGPVRLNEIAGRQEISVRYLEQMMTMLVASGLVNSMKGKRGGFSLAKPPDQIRLSEVVQAVEGSLAPVACVDDASVCRRIDLCVTHEIWARLKDVMLEMLSSITLEDMVKRHRLKQKNPGVPMPWDGRRRPAVRKSG
jgi:Rrf2 family protein